MRLWALSDLHLSLGGDKPMDKFGVHWERHADTMAGHWDRLVAAEDIVASPGDFSWATKPHQVAPDFAWLAARPGHKVLIKGNHDYWWPKSKTKLQALLPPDTWALKKNACRIGPFGFFGARGGDFAPLVRYGDQRSQAEIEASLQKEFDELERSYAELQAIEAEVGDRLRRICLFHYPPLPIDRSDRRFHELIRTSGAECCIYGHLHGSEGGAARVEGEIEGVPYHCASCDQIDFTPQLIAEAG